MAGSRSSDPPPVADWWVDTPTGEYRELCRRFAAGEITAWEFTDAADGLPPSAVLKPAPTPLNSSPAPPARVPGVPTPPGPDRRPPPAAQPRRAAPAVSPPSPAPQKPAGGVRSRVLLALVVAAALGLVTVLSSHGQAPSEQTVAGGLTDAESQVQCRTSWTLPYADTAGSRQVETGIQYDLGGTVSRQQAFTIAAACDNYEMTWPGSAPTVTQALENIPPAPSERATAPPSTVVDPYSPSGRPPPRPLKGLPAQLRRSRLTCDALSKSEVSRYYELFGVSGLPGIALIDQVGFACDHEPQERTVAQAIAAWDRGA